MKQRSWNITVQLESPPVVSTALVGGMRQVASHKPASRMHRLWTTKGTSGLHMVLQTLAACNSGFARVTATPTGVALAFGRDVARDAAAAVVARRLILYGRLAIMPSPAEPE